MGFITKIRELFSQWIPQVVSVSVQQTDPERLEFLIYRFSHFFKFYTYSIKDIDEDFSKIYFYYSTWGHQYKHSLMFPKSYLSANEPHSNSLLARHGFSECHLFDDTQYQYFSSYISRVIINRGQTFLNKNHYYFNGDTLAIHFEGYYSSQISFLEEEKKMINGVIIFSLYNHPIVDINYEDF